MSLGLRPSMRPRVRPPKSWNRNMCIGLWCHPVSGETCRKWHVCSWVKGVTDLHVCIVSRMLSASQGRCDGADRAAVQMGTTTMAFAKGCKCDHFRVSLSAAWAWGSASPCGRPRRRPGSRTCWPRCSRSAEVASENRSDRSMGVGNPIRSWSGAGTPRVRPRYCLGGV